MNNFEVWLDYYTPPKEHEKIIICETIVIDFSNCNCLSTYSHGPNGYHEHHGQDVKLEEPHFYDTENIYKLFLI